MSSRPAKILYVIGTLDVGGTETQLVELVTRLDRSQFEPVVCSLAREGPLAARLRDNGIRVYPLGFKGLGSRRSRYLISATGSWTLLSGLLRVIRRERPVVMHGMLFWAYVLGTFVAFPARVPIIVASRRSLGLFKADKPHYLFLERIADRMTDLFIANSEAVRQDTIARERLAPQDVLVIHNGLDLRRFEKPRDPALAGAVGATGSPVAIVVSNFIHYKGHRYFLEAWRQVLDRHPQAIALLVGDGVERPPLERMVDELRMRDSVRFLGVRSDVAALLGVADLYVHPSLQEGYSNAVLEAMAAGKPIVATAVGGNVEAIADGETGLLVPPSDAGALASAMLRLLGDWPRAEQMGQHARRQVYDTYEVGAMVRAYERVYGQLIARKAPSAAWSSREDVTSPAAGRRN